MAAYVGVSAIMSMLIETHPIWQSGFFVLIAAVAAAMLLQLVVQRFLPAMLRREHTMLGAAIFSVIGTTYAVLLAFMAMAAWEQYDAAGTLARHEANLVGSAYQATHGLPLSIGLPMQADLRAYLSRVIDVEWPAQVAGHGIPLAEPLLVRLHRTALRIVPANAGETNVQIALIRALDGVETDRRDRRLTARGLVPRLVWIVLLSGGALMVGFSFVLGGPTFEVHLLMTAVLVASGVLVLLLIVGLSSPFDGTVAIGPDAYADVLAESDADP